MLVSRNNSNVFSQITKVLFCAFSVLVLLCLSVRTEAKHRAAALEVEAVAYEEHVASAELEAKDSFYQKLADGFDVKILVAGDSIGACSGASSSSTKWTTLMKNHLKEKYGVRAQITNVSVGGGTAYTDYVRTQALPDNREYDLAIICCGQNDSNNNFGLRYEALIRTINAKYEKCSIISILESSQRSYTEKMITIQTLAEHYDIFVADTIAPFADGSRGEYSALTADGIHPNDAGYAIYADVINKIIDSAVAEYKGYNAEPTVPLYEGVEDFDNFTFIKAKEFERCENTFTYTLSSSVSGICGIDYAFVPGQNSCKIFIDGVEFAAPESYFDYDFTQRKIMVLKPDYITAQNTIEVRFIDEEQADKFNGICLSWR